MLSSQTARENTFSRGQLTMSLAICCQRSTGRGGVASGVGAGTTGAGLGSAGAGKGAATWDPLGKIVRRGCNGVLGDSHAAGSVEALTSRPEFEGVAAVGDPSADVTGAGGGVSEVTSELLAGDGKATGGAHARGTSGECVADRPDSAMSIANGSLKANQALPSANAPITATAISAFLGPLLGWPAR